MWQCNRYYHPVLQKRKLRSTQDKWISQGTLLVRVWALIQIQVYRFQSLDSFYWANAFCLATHLLLGILFFFSCWKSYLVSKTTIPQVQGQCYLFFWTCMAQDWTLGSAKNKNFFFKLWLVKAKNHKHWSTWNLQTVDKIAQVMTCVWMPSLFRKYFLASLITLDSSVPGLGLNRNSLQL